MTGLNSLGRDGELDGQAIENRLRIWTEYQGPCLVQVIIAVLAGLSVAGHRAGQGGVLRLIRPGRCRSKTDDHR